MGAARVDFGQRGRIGFPGALSPNVYKDFGPRLGVAYRMSDKTGYFAAATECITGRCRSSQLLQSARSNAPLNLRFANSIADQNGTKFNYALYATSDRDRTRLEWQPSVTTSVQGISQSSQSFLAMDVNKWNDDRVQQWTVDG